MNQYKNDNLNKYGPPQQYPQPPQQGDGYQPAQQLQPQAGFGPQAAAVPGRRLHAPGGELDAIDSNPYDYSYNGDLADPLVMSFVKRVYGYFAGGLLVTTLTCAAGVPVVNHLVATEQRSLLSGLAIGSLILYLVAFFGAMFMRKRRSKLKVALHFTFAAAAGAMSAPMIGAFVNAGLGSLVLTAFGVTTVSFFGLTVYVMTTGKDFRSLGGILTVGLLAIIGIAIMSIFFPFSEGFHTIVAAGGILLFLGFILYDTSKVTRDYYLADDAVGAALMLLLDFIILFKYVLRLLAATRD